MSDIINWPKLGLRINPFKIVPDKKSRSKLVWAGFLDIKTKFNQILTQSLSDDSSILALIISRYGGGKTHASYFFSFKENLPSVNNKNLNPTQLIVKTPQKGVGAVQELYETIIESIKWKNISNVVQNFLEIEENGLEQLEAWSSSEDIARLIFLLGDENDDIVYEAQTALLGNGSKSSMKTLRIRRAVSSNNDRAEVISILVRLLSLYNNVDSGKRVIIWIDELESLVYYTSKEYRPFSQFLRELFDSSPTFLTLMLNFSFSDPTDSQNIEIVLGKALIDRVKAQIIFDEAEVEEAISYLLEMLDYHRTEEFNREPLYPFNDQSIRLLFAKAPEESGNPLTPRTINKWVLKAIQETQEQNTDNIISEEQIESMDFSAEL